MPNQTQSLLFRPIQLRTLKIRNRLVIAPMCQYSAVDGMANDWHFAHLAKFAVGGAGVVFTEAAAVSPEGRITHGDLGIWSMDHARALERTVAFIKDHGAVPAIQIAHAGRKASMQRPWHGNGPLDESDFQWGEHPWEIVAHSPEPTNEGWLLPKELTKQDVQELVQNFADAAKNAHAVRFEIAEIHGAHGYLIHSFLSPLSNHRTDEYGGSLQNRMRFALEAAEAVRAVWPEELPLFFRVSATDAVEGGWLVDDSVVLAKELKALGVDVVDCSSRGIYGAATAARKIPAPGFQVPYAERIRKEAEIATQAVGLILTPEQAEAILQEGRADLVAIAREALYNPFWPLHAQEQLEPEKGFSDWPKQYGWWLERRAQGWRASGFTKP